MRVVNLTELAGPPQDGSVKSKGESKHQGDGWRKRSLGPKLRRHQKMGRQTRSEKAVRTKSWRGARPNEDHLCHQGGSRRPEQQAGRQSV